MPKFLLTIHTTFELDTSKIDPPDAVATLNAFADKFNFPFDSITESHVANLTPEQWAKLIRLDLEEDIANVIDLEAEILPSDITIAEISE